MEKIIIYLLLVVAGLVALTFAAYGLAMVWCIYEIIIHLLNIA